MIEQLFSGSSKLCAGPLSTLTLLSTPTHLASKRTDFEPTSLECHAANNKRNDHLYLFELLDSRSPFIGPSRTFVMLYISMTYMMRAIQPLRIRVVCVYWTCSTYRVMDAPRVLTPSPSFFVALAVHQVTGHRSPRLAEKTILVHLKGQ